MSSCCFFNHWLCNMVNMQYVAYNLGLLFLTVYAYLLYVICFYYYYYGGSYVCSILIQDKFLYENNKVFYSRNSYCIMHLNSFYNCSVLSSQFGKNPPIRGNQQHHQRGCLKACGNFLFLTKPASLHIMYNCKCYKSQKR